ncbi:MAG: hypothetical protein C5B52_01860 [Bacteroidetes bacterium]|nr:MAG: hypothetical protein C5B52_01860 [Bacteroidota bacterium]
MKILKWITFILAIGTISLTSCKKGDTGPQGPPGPAGPDSVLYSNWITLSMNKIINGPGDTSYAQTLDAPSITQDILDKGIILTYLAFVDNNGTTNVANASVYIDEVYYPAKIDLTSFFNYSGLKFRYVVIAGTIPGRAAKGSIYSYTKEQLRAMSYEEVMKLLGQSATKPGK